MPHHQMISGRPSMACRILLLLAVALLGSGGMASAQAPAAAPASLDQILKEVASYDGGIDSAALWKLRDYLKARKEDSEARAECEAKLLQFLAGPATPAARMAAGRHLRVVAGDNAVSALQRMLPDERVSDMALYALRQIPGAAAEKALVHSLATTARSMKTAVIGAVGERRITGAVPALVPLLGEPGFAGAAATALGAIGDDAAARALVSALPAAQADLKPVVAASLLKCAELALKTNEQPAALRLYEALASDVSLPAPVRRAATLGRISAAGDRAASLVMDLLDGPDTIAQEAAIVRVRDVIAPEGIAPVCSLLPRLSEASQIPLLSVLATYPGERVRPAILQAAGSGAPAVRIAALAALESTGDASVVPFLVGRAASARGPEQAAARSTLGAVKGRATDEAILAMLSANPSPEAETELLLTVSERRIFDAKQLVTARLLSESPAVRTRALRTMRVIGTPSDAAAVLDMLMASADDVESGEAEATAAALIRKVANVEGRSREVKMRLASAKDPAAKARLIGVLPLIGDNSALPLLRLALNDHDAAVYGSAVRALAAWPTTAARDDVIRLARDSRNETYRLLAIGGLVRMVGLDKYREPNAAIADLRLAADLSWRPEEQMLVLGALAHFPCEDALDLATTFLREPSVKAEAQAAIDAIGKQLK